MPPASAAKSRRARWTIGAGVVIGLAAAGIVLALLPPGRGPGATGQALSDCDGQISDLVIQYLPEGADIAGPVYAALLPQLPAGITVHVVCPNAEAFDELSARVGPVASTLRPVIVDHPMTCWSRDRWLALSPIDGETPITLLTPHGEAGADVWPVRAGDGLVAGDLAEGLAPDVVWRRSGLYFDGGDIAVGDGWAYVTPEVAARNVQRTVQTREALVAALGKALGRTIVLLEKAPPHHAGMFMMPIGEGRVMVGDPSLAQPLMSPEELNTLLPDGPDFTAETQELFDAVGAQCARAGRKVIRVPVVASPDGRTYLAYLNAVLDQREGRRIVYMPTYQGAEPLNAAATDTWRQAGYEVRPVDCTSAYRLGGSLRCLVSVLRRS